MLTQFLGLVLPFLTRVPTYSTNIQEFIECLIYHPIMISYNIVLYTQKKNIKRTFTDREVDSWQINIVIF